MIGGGGGFKTTRDFNMAVVLMVVTGFREKFFFISLVSSKRIEWKKLRTNLYICSSVSHPISNTFFSPVFFFFFLSVCMNGHACFSRQRLKSAFIETIKNLLLLLYHSIDEAFSFRELMQ